MRAQTAEDLMSPKVLAVHDFWSLENVANFLVTNKITGAPVANDAGHLVGVISLMDLARYQMKPDDFGKKETSSPGYFYAETDAEPKVEPQKLPELTAGDLMTPAVFKVDPDTSLSTVANIMIENRLHRLLVVRGMETVGIITSLDMLKKIRDEDFITA
jgi:CBS domain-containing protein